MRIGLFLPAFAPSPDLLSEVGVEAEARGFASLWLGEHAVAFDDNDGYPYAPTGAPPMPATAARYEPFQTLAFLAAGTRTIRLGTAICLVPQRNPVYTAQMVTTIDRLSAGRFDFGIGLGWSRREFAALDVPWPERGRRCDEYLEVMRTLWVDELSAFSGRHYTLPPCRQFPKPVQRPHPPILVGGNGAGALRRAARHGAGWLALDLSPNSVADGMDTLVRLREELGRPAIDGTRIVAAVRDTNVSDADVDAYQRTGLDELVVLARADGRDDTLALLDRMEAQFIATRR